MYISLIRSSDLEAIEVDVVVATTSIVSDVIATTSIVSDVVATTSIVSDVVTTTSIVSDDVVTTSTAADVVADVVAITSIVATTSINVDDAAIVVDDDSVPPDDTAAVVTNVPLMGSSRTSGGLFHGHALGNVPNHADFGNTSLDLDIPVKGKVFLYLTDQYPRDVNFESLKGESELVVMVKVVGGMAAILAMVARKCSIIQSK